MSYEDNDLKLEDVENEDVVEVESNNDIETEINEEIVEEACDANAKPVTETQTTESEQPTTNNTIPESTTYSPLDTPKKKGNAFIKKVAQTAILGLVAGLVMGLSFLGIQKLAEKPAADRGGSGSDISIEAAEVVESTEYEVVSTTITQIAENVMPSAVSITNLSVQEVMSFFFGKQEYEYETTGSGIIIGKNDEELLIVTNNHVIEGNKTLTVSFIDDKSVEAVVKSADSSIDIAVIAVRLDDIEADTMDKIKVAVIGDSTKLVVGEPAIAIGNALGYGQSVTSGIISAVEREIEGLDTKLIQTDAAINPGNSGGALLNIRGEIIGINTAKMYAEAVEGMGYAIPISDVKEIVEGMMAKQTREKVPEKERGRLGISCVNVDENAAKFYNIPTGAYINTVTEGGAADKAGISKGSVIVKFDGSSVSGSTALVDLLAYYRIGETVEIEIKVPNQYGEYEDKTVEVTLEKE